MATNEAPVATQEEMEVGISSPTDINQQTSVILAVDNSDQSEFAFEWFVKNSKMSHQRVIITHCPDSDYTTRSPSLLTGPEFYAEALREENIRIKHIEDKYMEKLKTNNMSGDFVVIGGRPGEAIIHASRVHNASMIVVGSDGSGRVKRTLLGSVSEYVLNHSVLPVLVCRYKRHLVDVTLRKQNTEETTNATPRRSFRERLLRRYHSVEEQIRHGIRGVHDRGVADQTETKRSKSKEAPGGNNSIEKSEDKVVITTNNSETKTNEDKTETVIIN